MNNSLCETCLLFEDCTSVCFMTECPFYYNKEAVDRSCKRWKRKHPIEAIKIAIKRKRLYKSLEAIKICPEYTIDEDGFIIPR